MDFAKKMMKKAEKGCSIIGTTISKAQTNFEESKMGH